MQSKSRRCKHRKRKKKQRQTQAGKKKDMMTDRERGRQVKKKSDRKRGAKAKKKRSKDGHGQTQWRAVAQAQRSFATRWFIKEIEKSPFVIHVHSACTMNTAGQRWRVPWTWPSRHSRSLHSERGLPTAPPTGPGPRPHWEPTQRGDTTA